VTGEDLIRFYRFALREGDPALADRLTHVLRADPALWPLARRELIASREAAPAASPAARALVERLARDLGGRAAE
jgi:hypothetical protein